MNHERLVAPEMPQSWRRVYQKMRLDVTNTLQQETKSSQHQKEAKNRSESGNRTRAISVKARDPNHWTNSDVFLDLQFPKSGYEPSPPKISGFPLNLLPRRRNHPQFQIHNSRYSRSVIKQYIIYTRNRDEDGEVAFISHFSRMWHF